MFDAEVLDLGLVYFKNAILNPEQIIKDIEDLDKKTLEDTSTVNKTKSQTWHPWKYRDGKPDESFFCLQKNFLPVEQINEKDFFYNELSSIANRLFPPLDIFIDKYKEIYPFLNIRSRDDEMRVLKYEKAGFLPGHTDQGVSTRCVSVLIYLNDDYEGGNIVFPNSKVSLKPEAGSMLFFPSNFLYVHEIEPIVSGIKYSLPNWYHNVTKEKRYFSTGEA